jgi:putative spermidine/putrescine transport system substrate-binding protein
MSVMKKLVGATLVCSLMMTSLVGCDFKGVGAGSGNPKQEEITFYFGGSLNVKELWETLVPMFEKKNPGIKVKLVYMAQGGTSDATLDRLIAAEKSGKNAGIDLYEGGLNDITRGQKEGIWSNLDSKDIPNLSKVDAKGLADVNQQAVPYRASCVVLAYNSAKVKNPPKTADELYNWIRQHPGRFTYNDPATGGSGDSFVQTAIYNFLPPEASQSSDPSIAKKWDKGFALLKELKPYMYQHGVFPKKNQGTLDLLANGEVDMIPAWSDMALEQINKKLLPDTIKLTQIQPAFTGGPSYLMVPKQSQHHAAVNKFINFVLSPEAQLVIVNKMNGYPGIKWSEMPVDVQKKFKDLMTGYRIFKIGDLGKEIQKRWQREVAGQ